MSWRVAFNPFMTRPLTRLLNGLSGSCPGYPFNKQVVSRLNFLTHLLNGSGLVKYIFRIYAS